MVEQLDVVGDGRAPRNAVHRKGLLHRAVLILVFNKKGEVFVQQRARTKDVSPLLYEASLSGHVRAGESVIEAAVRELKEELGIKASAKQLRKLFVAAVHELPEHEDITVYRMVTDRTPRLGKEVRTGAFMPMGVLDALASDKGIFTPVFSSLLPRLRPFLGVRGRPRQGRGTPAAPRRRARASA